MEPSRSPLCIFRCVGCGCAFDVRKSSACSVGLSAITALWSGSASIWLGGENVRKCAPASLASLGVIGRALYLGLD